ncbi:unnamed protein product [Sphagnum jensenii]|uniref:Uncharacterized protein n=1 Tax=Sphagnum jensenii TaxID=128206 RepID=A0ABP1BJB8_9BRYO
MAVLLMGGRMRGGWGGYLMQASDCNHITSNFGASQYGGCSWYTDAKGTPPSKLFQDSEAPVAESPPL